MKNGFKILYITIFEVFLLHSFCYAQFETSSENSDFESGNFSNWTGATGYWVDGKTDYARIVINREDNLVDGRQTIISELEYDKYTCGQLPTLPPDGGKYVAKLGNDINGAQVEQLKYSLAVTEENALFLYKYAVVFEDPGHEHNHQPFFDLRILNENNDLIDSVCGYNHIISGEGAVGFNLCEVTELDPRGRLRTKTIRWKPWTTVALDLTPYIGQTVTLEFTNADCSEGGHWSYAYMEVVTGSMEISVTACDYDLNATLEAPPGFSAYEWNTGETTRSIIVNQFVEGDIFECAMTSIPGCDVTLQVPVYREHVSVSARDTSVCLGGSVTLHASGAHTYLWSHDLGTSSVVTVSPKNTTTYMLVGGSEAGCLDTAYITVTVFEPPLLEIVANEPCAGGEIILQPQTQNLNSFSWSGPRAFVSTQAQPVISPALITHSGEYLLEAYDANGCKVYGSVDVVVNPRPNAQIVYNDICEGADIQLSGFPANMSRYEWIGPDDFSEHTQNVVRENSEVSMSGIYSLVVENEYGCVDTSSVEQKVYPNPIAAFSNTIPCAGSEMEFVNESEGANQWFWKFGNGQSSISENPSPIIYTNAQDYTVVLEVMNEYFCRDVISHVVSSYPVPVANFEIDNACIGEQITLKDLSYIEKDAITLREWDLDVYGTSQEQNPTFVLSESDVTPVSLIVSTEHCSDTVMREIQPALKPTLVSSAHSGCSPLSVTFPFNESGYSYSWDFGDGITSYQRNPEHVFFNDSGVTITYLVKQNASTSQGCRDSITHEVIVYSNPVPDFVPSSTQICSGQDVDFQNMSLFGDTFQWVFGEFGTSTEVNPTFTFYNNTESVLYVPVKLIATTSHFCVDSITRYIMVYPYPDKGVELSREQGCSPLIVELSTQSFGASYEWDFGDGTFEVGSQRVEHIFVNETKDVVAYPIRLNVSTNKGCGAEFFDTVFVYPSPKALFSIDANVGCSPYTSHILNETEGAIDYTWYIDNAQVDTISDTGFDYFLRNVTMNQQSHRIDLIVQNEYGCTSNYSRSVLVYPEVVAEFVADPLSGCSPFDVSFQNQSTGAFTYNWLFDDSTNSSNEHTQHTYVNIGKDIDLYNVRLVAISAFSCVDTSEVTQIKVFPQPKVEFSTTPMSGCSPLEVTIEDKSEGVFSYMWNYGDGTVSSSLHSLYTYRNLTSENIVYSLELVGENQYGCVNTSVLPVTVYPEVIPDFYPQVEGCSPLKVQFENFTVHAQNYSWDFDDSNISTVEHPAHVFVNQTQVIVDFNVTLKATSHMGCSKSISKSISVFPKPIADFIASPLVGCSPHSVTLEDISVGVNSYQWDYGNGTVSSSLIPNYTYSNISHVTGSFVIQLVGENQYGCFDTATQTISVYPELEPDFGPDTIGCSPLEVSFKNKTENVAQNLWFFGDGKVSTVSEPVNTFINETSEMQAYTVTLQVESHMGCVSRITKDILVFPSPKPTFVPSASYVILPESTIEFTNTTEGNWSYEWNFGDGSPISYTSQPLPHKYLRTGTYPVILKAYSPECQDTVIHYIVVAGKNVRAGYVASESGCEPLDVQFSNTSENALEFEWDFGDGSFSTEEHPQHVYTEPGTYVVQLTARNDDETDINRSHAITVYEAPRAQFSINPDIVYVPDAIIQTYNQSYNAAHSQWYFGDGTTSSEHQPSHQYQTEGMYDIALAVESFDGCKDSIMIREAVEVLLECGLKFPNAFTPIEDQNDGYYDSSVPEITNDIFHPIFNNIIEYQLQIFNRWGEIVFESTELERGWNGYYQNSMSKSDVYVWKCQATCLGGKNIELLGNVTLLR
ncbi:MAG: PKD domain-containing protein [Bacteroidales bacterium]|nr:PKD domain-containing protein [Bacteroidales bacterium]